MNTNAFYVRHIPTVTRPTIEPKVLAAYTQFVSELLRQLADEPLLAFNLSNYADRLDKLLSEYQKEFQHSYQSLEWHIGSFSKREEGAVVVRTRRYARPRCIR